MRVLLVIPAYNEAENIQQVVDNLRFNYPQYDYIIINDGSKDDTLEICRSNGYHFLNLPINLGLAGAFQTGARYAYEHGYDAIIQFDADGQHDAGYIAAMIEEMERRKCDIVIGSRFCNQKKPKTLRMLGSRLISLAIRLTTGIWLTDPTSGMRLFNRAMIKKLARNINYGPEPDTIAYLLRCGAQVSEVQVEMHDRMAGVSYFNISRSVRYMLNMFVSILLVQFFRPREMM